MLSPLRQWVETRYGSRRGLARTYWYRLQYGVGRYRNYRAVDWPSIERVVFVCRGNICRSAFAEAVARSQGVEASSCGIDTTDNKPPDRQAALSAQVRGFDIDHHKTRSINNLALRPSDLLVGMEPWQVKFLGEHLSRQHYYTLLGLWAKPPLPHIHDPYGSSPAYFEHCFAYIEKSVHELIKNIKKKPSR